MTYTEYLSPEQKAMLRNMAKNNLSDFINLVMSAQYEAVWDSMMERLNSEGKIHNPEE